MSYYAQFVCNYSVAQSQRVAIILSVEHALMNPYCSTQVIYILKKVVHHVGITFAHKN